MQNNKQTVAVVFGGISVEHDISIITGVQTLNTLKKGRYKVVPIYITKSGEWWTGEKLWDINFYSNFSKKSLQKVSLMQKGIQIQKFVGKKKIKLDFAFFALHGSFGENGCMQGLFDVYNIPYSSCGVLGSSICTNKYLAKLLCKSKKIPIVSGILLKEEDKTKNFEWIEKRLSRLNFPLIVKPNNLGSSIGVSFCKNKKELKDAIDFAFMFDREVLVEKAVANLIEYNIALLGNSFSCECSNIEKVVPDNNILSFEGKYMSHGQGKGMENLSRIVPAKIDSKLQIKIENLAKKIYKLLNLRGVVRLDFLFDEKESKLYFNEVNTIPGSLANYLFSNHQYNFTQLLEKAKDYVLIEREVLSHKLTRFSSSVLKNVQLGSKTKFGNSKIKE